MKVLIIRPSRFGELHVKPKGKKKTLCGIPVPYDKWLVENVAAVTCKKCRRYLGVLRASEDKGPVPLKK